MDIFRYPLAVFRFLPDWLFRPVDYQFLAADKRPNYFRQQVVFSIRQSRVWKYNTLWFDYNGKTVRFGREINRQDAELIRDTVNQGLGTTILNLTDDATKSKNR